MMDEVTAEKWYNLHIMNKRMLPMTFLKAGAAALSLAGIVGCAAPAYDVHVYLSPQLKEAYGIYPSIEVDVIGVDANGAERFASTPVEDYFRVGGALRRSTPHATLRFSESDLYPKLLKGGDDVWASFGGGEEATRLYVLVNLPPSESAAAGEKGAAKAGVDGRKVALPLVRDSVFNPRRWFGWPSRHFVIVPVGINVDKSAPEGAEDPVVVETPVGR